MTTSFDPLQEGVCLLFDASSKKQLIGMNPIRQVSDLGKAKYAMGYLAYPNVGLKNDIPDQLFYEYDGLLEQSAALPTFESEYRTEGQLEASETKESYIKKIHQIKDLLAAGEVYQINFAIRFRKAFFGDPYALFIRLSEINPTNFSAYLNCGDFQIVSASPERLLKVEDGQVMTQPIKGTIKKSQNSDLISQKEKLLNSEKERAELDMITDLERNDIGKICKYGTLNLVKEREVMELSNLLHTYSEVSGKLREDVGPEEVISAMFPGGSITGCPKKRAMEYISELEGNPRNIYTGSIGYLSSMTNDPMTNDQFKMDFNIAIRTLLIKDGQLEFWAGGGIVADSDPEAEYNEALLKAERFFDII